MIIKNDNLKTVDLWKKNAPPMGGDTQWKDGRSAKELAKYMTADFPKLPSEIEEILSNIIDKNSILELDAEHVTNFSSAGFGRGEGRNHDGILTNNDIFIGIEAKADETLGNLVADELKSASDNKKLRIEKLVSLLFDDGVENHKNIRYQLLTASAGALLEAGNSKKALLAVIVFKKSGCFSNIKIQENERDIYRFLIETKATAKNGYWQINTPNGKELLFCKIDIEVN